MSSVEELEAELAAQDNAEEAEIAEQRAIDLRAFVDSRKQLGRSNVGRANILFVKGLPTFALCRAPKPVEMKRFKDQTRPTEDEKNPDAGKAAEMLAAVTRIYPDDATYKAMCEARPGLAVALGVVAVNLGMGKAAAEGKG